MERSRGAGARAEPGSRAPPGTPLYVHLPFCAAKCHYCDFFSVPGEGQDVEGTLAAILTEARLRAPSAPRTVFLGGGTPSFLERRQLELLLGELDRLTGFRASALEVTAECNPESLDRDKARALLELGVTRLSIGFQSLDDAVLASFGRVHSAADSFRAYEAARSAGAAEVSVDLIYAAPGQRPAEWERDLGRVLDLRPEHFSAYNLTFEEDTLFRRWLESGRLHQLPEETELELFHLTRSLAASRGYTAYEISNFALEGRACRHNQNYWRNGSYVGLGPSAVSHVGGLRSGNLRALGAYRKRVAAEGHATDWSERLDPRARLGETWWLGLRTAEGVDPSEARRTAGFEERDDPALATAQRLAAEGLLVERAGRFTPSARGLPLCDAIAAEFLAGPSETPAAEHAGRPLPFHSSAPEEGAPLDA